ncbi:hypothetical protein BaRGS_00005618 [Batillaria attramentaria]|uniref:Uncharacterized protein n=1 Tax=Batillaria attramentaria TaxID=370345 RepID=A0ABD0LVL2_9CAEN
MSCVTFLLFIPLSALVLGIHGCRIPCMCPTNNGVEALNSSLKNAYLKFVGPGTLSTIVTILVREFVPDHWLEYVRANYHASSHHRLYNAKLPRYFHNMSS